MSGRKALGKGLAALYGDEQDENEQENGGILPTEISVSLITANPFQPRIDFSDETIEELAKSIKEQGLLQPIVLRKSGQKYQIISGERRFRAMNLLGNEKIPAIIRDDVDDKKMLELALVENIQRENLNDIETAFSYKKLIDDYDYTHEQISERFGKSRTLITNTLRLLKLPETIQNMLRNEQISTGHARALLSVENPILQAEFAQEIIKKSLSVREIEKKVSQISKKHNNTENSSPQKNNVLTEKYSALLLQINDLHGLKLNIVEKNSNKGKIEIPFSNTEEFEKIITFLDRGEL